MEPIIIGAIITIIIIITIVVVLVITIPPPPAAMSATSAPTPVLVVKTGGISACESTAATFGLCGGAAPSSGTIEYGRFDNINCTHPSVNANTAIFTKKYPLKTGTTRIDNMSAYLGEDPIPNVYKQYKINYTC